jgi:hypothetical protein
VSDIFISYASADRARIRPLVEALEARGWSVFWDTTLLPGETWRKKITTELSAARCVIVLWSENAVESHWVEQEADEGLRRRAGGFGAANEPANQSDQQKNPPWRW